MSLSRFVSLGGPTADSYGVQVGPSHSTRLYDLVTFLGVAQSHDVDFLPITWQSALGRLGSGGTGQINQSFVNLQTSFAFKRLLPLKAQEAPGCQHSESLLYEALACEVSVLSHPALRDHPHTANLVGVCCDFTSEDGKVLPVLVTEKTEYGDMLHFAKSDLGRGLSTAQRIELCLGVGSAIVSMHAFGAAPRQSYSIYEADPQQA